MVNFTRLITVISISSAVTFSTSSFAQQKKSREKQSQLNEQTLQGKLKSTEHHLGPHPTTARVTPTAPHQQGELCNCWVARDTSWTVVPFDCDGGNGGPGLPPDYRNDDWSDCVHLPFTFCFYGASVDSVFINNNGNVSIGTPVNVYTANSFPDPTFSMIAPLWSDVDTRGPSSGIEYYKLTNSHLIVQWDAVDYFESDTSNTAHLPLYNSYQLIMTDGTDPILPTGQNVSFCYKDMNWTTGDASGGVDGFGGTPATCGVNQGNGTDYFQIGLYDAPGTSWDGPYGNNDGIYSLSNQSFNFNVCSATNTPPIAVANYVCDTLVLCEGDTGYITAGYLSPEVSQITTLTVDTVGTHGVTILNDSAANLAGIRMQIIAQPGNLGYHTVVIIATDNGVPPATTTSYIIVSIINCGVDVNDMVDAQHSLQLSPNPVSDFVSVNYSSKNVAPISLEIKNALGQTVRSFSINNTSSFSKTISVDDLPAGIYFVRVFTEKETMEQRFIKK